MTDEQINIKIAELCGYRKLKNSERVAINPRGDQVGWSELHEYVHCIPNYAADLNACHEFEKTLIAGDFKQTFHATNRYVNELCKILQCLDTALFQFTHATARQRCEAFLRVHGQWEEEA